MANYLSLVNGVPRQSALPSNPLIYDQDVSVVASGGNGSTTLNGPISSGTAITLPSSGSYTLNANSIANISVYLNGMRLEQTLDWTTSGSGPTYTAIQLTFGLVANDVLAIRSERNS